MAARGRIVLQLVFTGASLVLLAGLNRLPGVDRWLPVPTPLRGIWLPLAGLVLLGFVWLVWGLWRVLWPEIGDDFPDLDAAWEEAVAALSEAGIGLCDAPLFLILGRTAGGDASLFSASQVPWSVEHIPAEPEAPLHVYANADGIYVTCAGASLLGFQSALWSGDLELAAVLAGLDPAEGPIEGPEDDAFKTLQPKGKLQEVQQVLAQAAAEGRGPQFLSDSERDEIRRLIGADTETMIGRKAATSLLKKPAQVERLTSRLQHLCRLIARDRRPYCALNGILILVPFAATDSDEQAAAAGSLCRLDLAATRAAAGVYCPALLLVTNMESAAGFREFVKRFPAEQRQRRLGQRFPLAPDLSASDTASMVSQSTEWVCHSMFPNWIYKLFRLERSAADDAATVTEGNVELYRLMSEMRLRQKRLGQLTVRAVQPEDGGPPLFGGCYVAATGNDPANDQAFVPGVFRRLLENQNYLCWTETALEEDAAQLRWTTLGYVGIALVAALVVGVLAWLWSRGRGAA